MMSIIIGFLSGTFTYYVLKTHVGANSIWSFIGCLTAVFIVRGFYDVLNRKA